MTPEAVVFLGVTPTAPLLELNRRVHARLDAAKVAVWPLYRPGIWVPHCTLAMRPADLTAALSALRAAVLPIEASPVALRIVEVPTGKVDRHRRLISAARLPSRRNATASSRRVVRRIGGSR